MMLFDTHAHLDDDQLFGNVADVVRRAEQAGVVGIMAIGTTAASSQRCIDIAAEHEIVSAAVGIQPNYAAEQTHGDWQRIVDLAGSPLVKAIGETGLDHYWDYAPLSIQRDLFVRHIQLALQLDLPLVIHMREPKEAAGMFCGHDILAHLRKVAGDRPVKGIMHSFTGDLALVQECLAMGLHISFAGMVTYKKSNELREVAAAVPDDRILIETDAPYLSPQPKRGQRPNEPALVVHTAECLADVRGKTPDDFAALTTANARRLFGFA